MSVKIRFNRLGKPRHPFYRIVVTDSRKPRNSEYLDKVGHVNPLVKKEERSHNTFFLDREKILSWLKQGAQPTQVVLDLLKEEKIWEEFNQQKPKKKKPHKRKSRSNPISEMLKRREERQKLEERRKKTLAAKADKAAKTDQQPSQPEAEAVKPEPPSEPTEPVAEIKGEEEVVSSESQSPSTPTDEEKS